jgi:LytR cell envelope-related transcriptional attenuator
MTDLIDEIGPFLGIAAFLGLAILAFLIIQQAREVRRLREWAGRAPERAGEAADAEVAAAEARGEEVSEEEPEEAPPSRAALWLRGIGHSISERWAAVDRRLPIDPRYIVAVLAAGVIAAGVLTSGFGLVGGDDTGGGGNGGKKGGDKPKEEKVEVAVLNATQEESVAGGEISGVQGLADVVAKQVIQPTDFAVGEKTDAPSGFDQTTIMFEPDSEPDANELAEAVTDQLGQPEVTPMIGEIRDVAAGAPLALIIGRDDADFGSQ